ncbi:thiol-disulfide oxidoreductase DCC family protein [Namhaeicola litoreus]|uniref:Thiol-disulfide oxidoreductase DCC family protein n=1 Tax=Namhaeicola litoreus TaxID=1052145 RepID=A0ABW3Y3Y3_9FLAO
MKENQKPIIFFDGYCNLCSSSIQFILKRDKAQQLLFSSLQSDAAKELLLHNQSKNNLGNSVLFLEQNKVYEKSEAVLRILKYLDFPYRLLTVFKWVPIKIRDKLYDFVAKHRFKWFGRKEICYRSASHHKERFIE